MENKNVCGLLGIETGTSANIKGADGQPAGRCGKKKKAFSCWKVCILQRRMIKDNFRALNLFDWPSKTLFSSCFDIFNNI